MQITLELNMQLHAENLLKISFRLEIKHSDQLRDKFCVTIGFCPKTLCVRHPKNDNKKVLLG